MNPRLGEHPSASATTAMGTVPAILVLNILHPLFIVASAACSTKANDLKSRYQALLGAATVLAALFAAVLLVGVQNPGPIDEAAARQIRQLCNNHADCRLPLNDILPGNWDTFYEFGGYINQDEIDQALGTNQVHVAEPQRTLVFEKDNKIIKTGYAPFGRDRPLDEELVFQEEFTSRAPTWVKYSPTTLFQVTFCETEKNGSLRRPGTGTYYLLTPYPYRQRDAPQCQSMF